MPKKQDSPIHFKRAAKMASWQVHEAARLFCGLDPDPQIKLAETAMEDVRRLEHVFNRAMQDKQIKYGASPWEWISLAKQFHLVVPPDLRKLVAAHKKASDTPMSAPQSKSAETRVRKSLLRIVALLAISGFSADRSNLAASATSIAHRVKNRGFILDDETIRAYLQEAQDAVNLEPHNP